MLYIIARLRPLHLRQCVCVFEDPDLLSARRGERRKGTLGMGTRDRQLWEI